MVPGHVVVTRDGRTRYVGSRATGKALEQVSGGGDHGLTVHCFCRRRPIQTATGEVPTAAAPSRLATATADDLRGGVHHLATGSSPTPPAGTASDLVVGSVA